MAIPHDPYSIRSFIFLQSSSHRGNFLLLEGDTDSRFYFKFFNNQCSMMVPCGNKQNVLDVLKMKIRTNRPVFGIVDADFDCLDCVKKNIQYNDKTFLTDTHDIETMIIKTEALQNLMIETADDELLRAFEKRKSSPLRDILIDSAKKIGAFRLYNEIFKKNYKFDGIDFLKFIDKNTLECNYEQMVLTVKENSRNRYTDITKISSFIEEIEKRQYDPWIICNGHDLAQILLIGLRYIFGKPHMKYGKYGITFCPEDLQEIQSKLRMNYDCKFFRETQLYSKIKQSPILNSTCNSLKC